MNIVEKYMRPTHLASVAFWLVALSQILVYYTIEPSPADFAMALAIALAGVIIAIRRNFDRFSRIDIALALYLILVVGQMVINRGDVDVRFALITVY